MTSLETDKIENKIDISSDESPRNHGKTNQPALKSQAVRIESVGSNEKINLLAENVQSLLDRNQTIDNEIKIVQSNVESIAKGLTNQIKQLLFKSAIRSATLHQTIKSKLSLVNQSHANKTSSIYVQQTV